MLEFARSQSWNISRQDLCGMLITMSKGLDELEARKAIDTAAKRKKNKDLFVGTAAKEEEKILREGSRIQWHSEERPSA